MTEQATEPSPPATPLPSTTPAEQRPAPTWVAPLFAAFALVTVPWIIYLIFTLKGGTPTVHYRAAWVGFDCLLLTVIAATAYFAWKGRPQVAFTATAAATMMVVDAWFDVVTTPKDDGLAVSLVLAVFVELPLAGMCLWIATHAGDVLRRRVESLSRRARRAERIALVQRAIAAGQVDLATLVPQPERGRPEVVGLAECSDQPPGS